MSSLARPSPRHDDGRPHQIALRGAVVAPRNKNKSTDRLNGPAPRTAIAVAAAATVIRANQGGGLPRKRPFPPPDPHNLSDSTQQPRGRPSPSQRLAPHPPDEFDGPPTAMHTFLLPPELSRLRRPSRDGTQTRTGDLVPIPTSIQYMPGGTRQYIRERGEDMDALPRVDIFSSKGGNIAITMGWGAHRNDSTTKGGR